MSAVFTVIVTGSRHYTDFETIRSTLAKLPASSVIVHGDCSGADRLADLAADHLCLRKIPCPADWTAHGRAAGPIRNAQMLKDHSPDLVIAFPQKNSSGTWDMIRKAFAAGVEVRIIPEKR
jgi:hypothetical protein